MPSRWTYRTWLTDGRVKLDDPIHGKGLYLWLLELPNGHFRFVHVGIAADGGSTLASRTRKHLCGQRVVAGKVPGDRIHACDLTTCPPYGSLGPDLRNDGPARLDAARRFLSNLRIMFILPVLDPSLNPSQDIKLLEGLIARSAAELLDLKPRKGGLHWETTNTIPATRRLAEPLENLPVIARDVANTLNGALRALIGRQETGMMPPEPRRGTT